MSRTQNKTYILCLTALFTALTCVLAQVQIPLGSVPFTMAVFAVFLSGALLPPGWAAASQLAYLALGCIGLPVFVGFSGGVGILAGPTGGYALAYPLMAWIPALPLFRTRGKIAQTAGMLAGLAVCYFCGTLWFMVLTGRGVAESLALCVLPFALPDVAKAALAATLAGILRPRLAKARPR